MKIRNTLDHARDIAVDGGFIPVDAGATVNLNDHMSAGAAQKLGRSLNEQDGWTSSEATKARATRKRASKKAASAEPEAPPVADEPPAEPVNEENHDGS